VNAFIDVRCKKCGHRFGFQGDMTKQPPCPKCGHQESAEWLARVQAGLDEDHRLMLLHPSKATADELRRQRVLVGLTLHQAASFAGIPAKTISDIENGRATPTPAEARELSKAYGCGEE
jgi:DNA-binding XRE family transcriptional regulator